MLTPFVALTHFKRKKARFNAIRDRMIFPAYDSTSPIGLSICAVFRHGLVAILHSNHRNSGLHS